MKYALVNGTIFTGESILTDHGLIISDHIIHDIIPRHALPETMPVIDVNGANISPGFIDLQLNGCGGVMFNDEISTATLHTMHRANLLSGCTNFLPTLITSSDENMQQAVAVARDYMHQHPHHVLGLHLEGPYLNPEKKGIHNIDFIRQSNQSMVDFMCQNHDVIAQLTMAPEMNDAAHIRQLAQAGITVSLGHTNCSYKQAKAGFAAGMTSATHLFNAMSSITGREPGAVGAVYDTPSVYAGIIADGFHVDFANIRIAKHLKKDKLLLVTDATAPAGADIESFIFVGKTVYYKDGKCIDENGTLGGSALTMNQAIKNSVKYVGIELDEALRMATLYPAQSIGIDKQFGRIAPGYIANLAIFDCDLNVDATVVNGQYGKH
ncbi:N-acetylglucosamine-6-phosphate deacetylase [Vibrio zhugei]|uniref:N-acetylglucosamine-6-phosphate deacetylase n=1 Tax=Vibrio zhugei TaxID=2479546 RepID=A0ABV7C3V8_9VIBR|nr:N-acetylglucosamine-6-phosphate deacetylase [Vibrio zhugei]